jgi:putative zinc finger protein
MNGRRAPRCTRAYDPRLREAVGAYLLGGLEPTEADEVSVHLSECESCRAEYAELSDLVPLMALVTEQEAVLGPVRPEPAVLGRVIASSRRQTAGDGGRAERRGAGSRVRPRRTRFALAAACVVLAAVGSAVGMRLSTHPTPSTAWSSSAMVEVNPYGSDITAMADVTPSGSGSKINFTMEGVPKNYTCWMVVKGSDGHTEQTGSWNAPNGGLVVFAGTSSYTPDHISGIDIMLADGTDLMHIAHP